MWNSFATTVRTPAKCPGRAAPSRVSAIGPGAIRTRDRKSTRLNSSHSQISYAVFCLKKKKIKCRQRIVAVPHGLNQQPFDRIRGLRKNIPTTNHFRRTAHETTEHDLFRAVSLSAL